MEESLQQKMKSKPDSIIEATLKTWSYSSLLKPCKGSSRDVNTISNEEGMTG